MFFRRRGGSNHQQPPVGWHYIPHDSYGIISYESTNISPSPFVMTLRLNYGQDNLGPRVVGVRLLLNTEIVDA